MSDCRGRAVESPEAPEGRHAHELLHLPVRERRVDARHPRQAGRAEQVANVEAAVDMDRSHARGDDLYDAVPEVDEREAFDVDALDEDLVQQRHRPSG